jgi:hypothetical protein
MSLVSGIIYWTSRFFGVMPVSSSINADRPYVISRSDLLFSAFVISSQVAFDIFESSQFLLQRNSILDATTVVQYMGLASRNFCLWSTLFLVCKNGEKFVHFLYDVHRILQTLQVDPKVRKFLLFIHHFFLTLINFRL